MGSDIRQGKKTFLYLRLAERAGRKDKALLRSLFGRPDLSPRDIARVREMAARYGVSEDLRKTTERYARRARAVIRGLGVEARFEEVLETLLDFSLTRTS